MIIRGNNLQKWLFDYFEGNLTPHEEIELNRFIAQNPSYQNEFDAWEKSYLSNGKSKVPVYPGASELLVETSLWNRVNWRYAAIIIVFLTSGLLVGYFNYPDNKTSINDSELASESKLYDELSQANNMATEESLFTNIVNEYPEKLINDKEEESSEVNLNTFTQSNHKKAESLLSVRNNKTSSNTGKHVLNSFNQIDGNESKQCVDKVLQKTERNNSSVINTVNKVEKEISQKQGLAKINSKPVMLFDNEIKQAIPTEAEKIVKNSKRKYHYVGFKNLAGKGIGVGNNKSKQDKESTCKRIGADNDMAICENGVENKKNDRELEKKRKVSKRKGSEIALMNLYDPIFISANIHPLQVNGALSGALGVPRIKSSTRFQNNNSADYILSSVNSFDMYIQRIKAGVGIVLSANQFNGGMYSDYCVEFNYAQKFEISRETSVTTSLKYRGRENLSDISKINTNTSMEVERGEVYTSYSDVSTRILSDGFNHDMGAAVWYDGRYLYGGMQVDNLLHSKAHAYNELQAGRKLPTRLCIQLGTDYRRSLYSDIVISPQLNFSSQGGVNNLWVGSSFKFGSLVAGIGIGTIKSTSLKGLIGVQNHALRVVYSFDYSNSSLESGMFASHELSLRVLFGVKGKNWSRFKN